MQDTKPQYFLIDFDSTFIKSEGLDELAAVALQTNPNKEALLIQIKTLTEQGMLGKIPFGKSLRERINLLKANRGHIEKVTKILKKSISPSILRNKKFFKTYKNNIYIISGGFKELILPVVKSFGIPEDHIFANTFLFDKNDEIVGIDKNNFLAKDNGKVKLIRSLNLPGDITVIGDGYTDYAVKKAGLAKQFIAYTENITREIVVQKADSTVASFDEFLYNNNLPLSTPYRKDFKKDS